MQKPTEFEMATAEQLATERGHSKPTAADTNDAKALVESWNIKRLQLGLQPWE